MRVNVYAEEMTERVEIISKVVDGHTFTGIRFYLELPVTTPIQDGHGNTIGNTVHKGPFMHKAGDDDSSAVTFWGKSDLRVMLNKALYLLDLHYGKREEELLVP